MKTWLRHIWSDVRTSFWFVPGLLTVGSIVMAILLLMVDREWGEKVLEEYGWLKDISAEGTRQLLSTIASSVLTLAGLTFSATLVALTMASSQFGPRLVRNFIRSFGSQIVLGGLLGTFAYCLLILRAVRGIDDGEFIPHISALVAFLMTLSSLGLFIFFIHYLAMSIQAENIVARVYGQLSEAIDRFFPEKRTWAERSEDDNEEATPHEKVEWEELDDEVSVDAIRDGYVVGIDYETLMELAVKRDVRFRLLLGPGDFVRSRQPIVAYPNGMSLSDEERELIHKQFVINPRLTAEEDFLFCFRQLEEIALRALSPGINDPFTAFNCIDYIGAALKKIARREMPKRLYFDDDDVPRIRAVPMTFEKIITTSLSQIRHSAVDKPSVALRMLDMLTHVAVGMREEASDSDEVAEALYDEGKMLVNSVIALEPAEKDREEVERLFSLLKERLGR